MKKSNYIYPILISVISYLIFFFPLLRSENIIYSGKDSVSLHYQSRAYLYENLKNGVFPFWTERILLGYPISADLERGYLNPVNLLLIYAFGPITSYKILHLAVYLLGSVSFFYFLKKYSVGLLGYAVSNFIYYFSFFHLYHQQHFNIVLTAYLLPLGLYLIDKFSTKKRFGYLLFSSMLSAFCFYFGSYQMVFLLILLQLIYFAIAVRKPIGPMIWFLFWFLVFIIPALQGIYYLYYYSQRSVVHAYTEGSYSPAMFSMVLFPFLFNHGSKYMGVIVSREYFMHEVYSYVGLSSFLFSLVGFSMIKSKRLRKLMIFLFTAFFVLGFVKYFPIVKDWAPPPISFFRYWSRSVIYLVLGCSVLAGFFISKLGKYKPRNYVTLPLVILTYLLLLMVLNWKQIEIVKIAHLLMRNDYEFGSHYLIWGAIVFATLLLITFVVKNKHTKILRFVCVFIVIADLVVFGKIGFETGIRRISDVIPNTQLYKELSNKRILDLSQNVTAENALLNESWGITGYAVLFPNDVWDSLHEIGFNTPRRLDLDWEVNPQSDEFNNNLANLGVHSVVQKDGFIKEIGGVLMENEGVITKNVEYHEGHIGVSIITNKPMKIKTKIRYYPGWTLTIDGKETKIQKQENNPFLQFDISTGEHDIQLKYAQPGLKSGLLVSAMLGGIALFSMIVFEKKLLVGISV